MTTSQTTKRLGRVRSAVFCGVGFLVGIVVLGLFLFPWRAGRSCLEYIALGSLLGSPAVWLVGLLAGPYQLVGGPAGELLLGFFLGSFVLNGALPGILFPLKHGTYPQLAKSIGIRFFLLLLVILLIGAWLGQGAFVGYPIL